MECLQKMNIDMHLWWFAVELYKGVEKGMESIGLVAAMTLPSLVLQNPHKRSKPHEHTACLERRLQLWFSGDIDSLVFGGNAIQQRLKSSLAKSSLAPSNDSARKFANELSKGNVKTALRMLSSKARGMPVPLSAPVGNSTVLNELIKKHPSPSAVVPESLISSDAPLPPASHPVIFSSIDGNAIRKAALCTNGAAGPSGLDARQWRRMCTSFGSQSDDLCTSLAAVARRIASEFVDPVPLRPLLNSRLIALDKDPGVRPIGIGETSRRIIAKAIIHLLRRDVMEASGNLQLCAGQEAGCEAAVHAMRSLYDSDESQGMLLVDASNAFNSLNRQSCLLNMYHLCPSLATMVTNTYRQPSSLFIDGTVILSQEGCTQGDPLSMPVYAVSTVPIIQKLDGLVKQAWFADDGGACGSLKNLLLWWTSLADVGPAFGYHPNPAKTWLVVKEEFVEEARQLFAPTGIQITSAGRPYLGSAIGSKNFVEQHTINKVSEWIEELKQLEKFSASKPQAAYSALTHGVISKWTYYMRTTLDIASLLEPLDSALQSLLSSFVPHDPNDIERRLLSLPVRLGLKQPTKEATLNYDFSVAVTAPLVARIVDQSFAVSEEVITSQASVKSEQIKNLRQLQQQLVDDIINQSPPLLQHCIRTAQLKGASSWLSTLPVQHLGFVLHKTAFRDAICIRYGWTPPNLPTNCICGRNFSLEHAFSCSFGTYPIIRHNEIRDLTASLLTRVCHNVAVEPKLQPLSGEAMHYRSANTSSEARLDVKASGLWGSRFQSTFFDIRVFNSLAQSNLSPNMASVFQRHEQEKRRHYDERVRVVEYASFLPIVFSSNGGMGKCATSTYKRIASLLSSKMDSPYSHVLGWLRCALSFSLVKSAVMCLRGSRSRSCVVPPAIDFALAEGRIPL